MVAVPAATPVTKPEPVTLATAGLLLLHVPPLTELLSVIVAPAHTVPDPLIVPAVALPFTVTVAVLLTGPQLAVTV